MQKSYLPLATMEKLLKKAGAERVSVSAMEALRTVLEQQALQLASKVSTYALHAGRRTIMKQDVELASEK